MSSLRRVQYYTAVVSLAAFTLSIFSASIHYATVSHTICAEHGDLIHGESASHSESTSSENTTLSFRSENKAHEEEAHEHDHCVLCQTERKEQLTHSSGTVAIFKEAPQLDNQRDSFFVAAAQYITAPKTSPPA